MTPSPIFRGGEEDGELGPAARKKVHRLKHFKIPGLISSEAPVKQWPVSHASYNASILGL